MSKRTIIILIICTAILAVASVTTIQQKSGISNIFITSVKDMDETQLESLPVNQEFSNPASDIYLVIMVKHLNADDRIEAIWYLDEDGYYGVVQENIIHPEGKGSGKITISLAKKDSRHYSGNYRVEVYLNQQKEISKSFSITEK